MIQHKKPGFWVSVSGLIVLSAAFLSWLNEAENLSVPELLSALASAALFAAVCLRFVTEWMRSWQKATPRGNTYPETINSANTEPPFIEFKIFVSLISLNALVVFLVYILRQITGHPGTFRAYLEFWRCTDSGHYLDISREWYLSDGEWKRLVQLVFLPGYPIAVRFFSYFIGYDLYSGLIVSALSFAGAGCVLYRLLRLDFSYEETMRTIKYLYLFPGVFFFTAPMSESLFLLLCASSLYFARTGRWMLGYFFGGLAAFTRSLGLTLFVPLLFDLISDAIKERGGPGAAGQIKYLAARLFSLLIIPAGFALYCCINYFVAGDPFKFMEYQSQHWHQHLGWFFNTAAYQMEYAIRTFIEKPENLVGLWIPNIISCFASLVFMLLAEKKMRPSYVAWYIAYYAIAIGATWLLSAPRYLMVLIPVPLSVSIVARNAKADIFLTASCAILSLLYFIPFVMRWQVW